MATYSEALQEAYASAPTDVVILQTLEIRHPYFKDEGGNPMSVYLVKNGEDIEAVIEEGHPIDSGKQVKFLSCPFQLVKPGKEPGVVPQLKIQVDNVSAEINKHLEMAVSEEIPIKVILREYLSTDLSQPESIPLEFEIMDTDLNKFIIVFTCMISVFTDKTVPTVEYTSATFPNLVQ
tara:strand:- start:133 stop:666 length:534 start_codon:yes stop_codon:yes gene_type:complete